MKILLVGSHRMKLSEIVEEVLKGVEKKIYGFCTFSKIDKDGTKSIFIKLRDESDDQSVFIGTCKNEHAIPITEGFETFSMRLQSIPADCIVVMEELGSMETQAELFQKQVFRLFETSHIVLAAVRDKHTPFLDAVTTQQDATVFFIKESNRTQIITEIRRFFLKQIEE